MDRIKGIAKYVLCFMSVAVAGLVMVNSSSAPPQKPTQGFDSVSARIEAAKRLDEMTASAIVSGLVHQWKPLGPMPTISGSNHWGAWTSSIAVDPTDPNTVFIGNPGSGVWKTTNGGRTWKPKTDNAPALAIGAIAIAPSDSNVIYAGTGNWWDGVGVLRSIDKGATWRLLPGTFSTLRGSDQFWNAGFIFSALAVNPTNPNVVLAGVWYGQEELRGIYRSSDGGISWKQVFSGGKGSSIVWERHNPLTVYAAIGENYSPSKNGIYKSADGGLSWRSSSNGIDPALFPKSADIFLSLSSGHPNVLYASVGGSNGGTLGVFKTWDGGDNWTSVPVPPPSRTYRVVVHPQDPNTVLVGDIQLYRSRDGGRTWDNVSRGLNGTSTFGDYRALSFSADGTTLYIGSDGGVFKTQDALANDVNWTELNDTLNTVLFYIRAPISIHPTDVNIGLGGAQDLGILMYSGNTRWTQVFPCDGGTTLIDFVNPLNMYATCDGIRVLKSSRAGVVGSWWLAINGIDTNDRSEFVPTIAMDPNDPNRLFYGTYRLYQSRDGAATWAAISTDVSNNCWAGVTSIAVSPADSNFVYVASLCGSVYVSRNSASASPIWENHSSGLPQRRDLTSVVADPSNAFTAYLTFSGFTYGSDKQGHVFKTTNAGASWVDISANLPNIPANYLAVDPDLPGTLYLATDVGVFQSSNGGATWRGLSNGLPHAYVEALFLHGPSRTLRASTLGRGMWDLHMPTQIVPVSVTPPILLTPADGPTNVGQRQP